MAILLGTVAPIFGIPYTPPMIGVRIDGEEVWRVVHPQGRHRLVLMAEQRTTDLWLRALAEGVATVLPLLIGMLASATVPLVTFGLLRRRLGI